MPPSSLHAGLPEAVRAQLAQGDWAGLAADLAAGRVDPGLRSGTGASLFECTLEALERLTRPAGSQAVPPAPMGLLDAFLAAGIGGQVYQEGRSTPVSMAAHYGQWAWASRMAWEGWPVEGPDGSALHALVDGRLQRALIEGEARTSSQEPVGNVRWLRPPAGDGNDGDHLPVPVWMDAAPAERGAILDLCSLLVDHGARLEFQDPTDEAPALTPLRRAIVHLDVTAVVALVAAGARLDARDPGWPQRPLELAVAGGSEGVVTALLDAGAPQDADPSLPPREALFNRPLVVAAQRGLAHLVPLLLERLPPDEQARWGAVAMHVGASQGHVPVLQALRGGGIPYSVRTESNQVTLLHQAAFGGNEGTLAFLVRRGLAWDAPDASGVTAADVLQSRHPHLAPRFGLTPRNVRVLFPGRKAP